MALDRAFFRDLLLQRLDALDEEKRISSDDRAPVTLDQDSVGRLSRIDAIQMQAMALAQERRRETERLGIKAALERIKDDEYGYCLKCGDEIAEPRLKAYPAVSKCFECASEK